MKASTEKVVETLEKIKTFLENALEKELEHTTKEYTELKEKLDVTITQAQEQQERITEENRKLQRIAEERYRLKGINGRTFDASAGWYKESFQQPNMLHLVKAANKRMQPFKQKLTFYQEQEKTLREQAQALPQQENLVRLNNQLRQDTAKLSDNLASLKENIPQDEKAHISENQELFLLEVQDVVQETRANITKIEAAFNTLKEQPKDTKELLERLQKLINQLSEAQELIKGGELKRLGSLLSRYDIRHPPNFEVSFGNIDHDAYDQVIIDTSFIIDIHLMIQKRNIKDFRRILPPTWLKHKRFIIPQKVFDEIEGTTNNNGLIIRKPRLITQKFWDYFKEYWPKHHVMDEHIRNPDSKEIMSIVHTWWNTPKGREDKNAHGGFTSKDYFLGTADCNICLYILRHHRHNTLIAAWDEDINKVINNELESPHGRIGYLTSRELNLIRRPVRTQRKELVLTEQEMAA